MTSWHRPCEMPPPYPINLCLELVLSPHGLGQHVIVLPVAGLYRLLSLLFGPFERVHELLSARLGVLAQVSNLPQALLQLLLELFELLGQAVNLLGGRLLDGSLFIRRPLEGQGLLVKPKDVLCKSSPPSPPPPPSLHPPPPPPLLTLRTFSSSAKHRLFSSSYFASRFC